MVETIHANRLRDINSDIVHIHEPETQKPDLTKFGSAQKNLCYISLNVLNLVIGSDCLFFSEAFWQCSFLTTQQVCHGSYC